METEERKIHPTKAERSGRKGNEREYRTRGKEIERGKGRESSYVSSPLAFQSLFFFHPVEVVNGFLWATLPRCVNASAGWIESPSPSFSLSFSFFLFSSLYPFSCSLCHPTGSSSFVRSPFFPLRVDVLTAHEGIFPSVPSVDAAPRMYCIDKWKSFSMRQKASKTTFIHTKCVKSRVRFLSHIDRSRKKNRLYKHE